MFLFVVISGKLVPTWIRTSNREAGAFIYSYNFYNMKYYTLWEFVVQLGNVMVRTGWRATITGLAALMASWVAMASAAESVIVGPIAASVEAVIDGDTLRVRAAIWPGHEVIVNVRAAGIDTPEIRHPKCDRERRDGLRAKAFVVEQIDGEPVFLRDIRNGKYAGRVVADVILADGRNLALALIRDAGLGVPYGGGKRAGAWCTPDEIAAHAAARR